MLENITKFLESYISPIVDFLSFIFLGGDYEVFGEEISINLFGLPVLVIWLIIGGIFFTFKLRFVNIRLFKHAIAVARGHYAEPDAPGRVTQLQALFTAVAATVGLGNIAGVAIAVTIGGPGAVIWMMIAAFFGMSLKCAEVILGQKYRHFDKNGHLQAGAFYYLQKGLEEKGLPRLARFLGISAAILCVGGAIGAGMMFQSNQSISIISDTLNLSGTSKLILVLIITAVIGFIILGGIKRIASFAEKIVPAMAITYVLSCLVILAMNSSEILNSIKIMFISAFAGDAVYGGVIGAIIQGVKRSVFSNEAGVGSAPIAHAAGKTKEPVREGSISLLEPFIDTIIICFMTGIVLVVTGVYQGADIDGGGVLITSKAFSTIGNWFTYILSITVFFFAFSTMLTYSYYGQQAWLYLSKGRAIKVCQILFLSAIFIGGLIELSIVVNLADILFILMSVPNLIGMYLMSGLIKKEVDHYIKRLKSGKFEALRKKNTNKV